MTQTPCKHCPRCGQPALLSQSFCHNCGFAYAHLVQQEANLAQIILMWMFTAACFVFASISIGVALLLDVPAFILAIVLVRSRSRADKINGAIKLGLEGLAFIIAFGMSATPKTQTNTFPDTSYFRVERGSPPYSFPKTGNPKTDATNRAMERMLNF